MQNPGIIRKVAVASAIVIGIGLGSTACGSSSKPELKEVPVKGIKPTDRVEDLRLDHWIIEPLQTPSGVENGFQFSIDGTDLSGSLTCPKEGGSVKGYVGKGTDIIEYTSKITKPCVDGVFDNKDISPDIVNGLSILVHKEFGDRP